MFRFRTHLLALCVIFFASVAMCADSATQTRRVTVEGRVTDAQGKTLWSLMVTVSLGGDLPVQTPNQVSSGFDVPSPATTRPGKWAGKRMLEVSRLSLEEKGEIRVEAFLGEKTPIGTVDQSEYLETGVHTNTALSNGEEVCIGSTQDLRYILKVSVGGK